MSRGEHNYNRHWNTRKEHDHSQAGNSTQMEEHQTRSKVLLKEYHKRHHQGPAQERTEAARKRCATSPSPKGWHPQVEMVPRDKCMMTPKLTSKRQEA